MKKIITMCGVFASLTSFSQQIHRCGTYEAVQHQAALNSEYLGNIDEVFNRAKNGRSQDRATVYTIPVVFHVVYSIADENVPDSVLLNQLNVLNEAYGYTNADQINLRDTFNTIVGSTDIQFELALIGPDGNPTNGITRTSTAITEFGSLGMLTGDMSDLERIKSTSDGGEDAWDQSRYLNIWVADMSVGFGGQSITALMGYATPPDNLSNWPAGSTAGMSDGVVLQYQAVGSNNPIPLDPGTGAINFEGKTCVHEVGHYLGLRHIWGDGDCSEQDGIDDTPNAIENSQNITNCDTLNNTCTDNIGSLGDLPNMQENYMDYSPESCQVAFTIGQSDLMRGVIETHRWDLIDNYPVLSTLENQDLNVTIYPNPSTGMFTIKGTSTNGLVEMFSNNGQLIYTIMTKAKETIITDLPNGIYFVRISNTENIITKKITVIK
jgi:hypothetical protein